MNGVLLGWHLARGAGFGDDVRDMWLRLGDLGDLARRPLWNGHESLLRGDDYFFPQVRKALEQLERWGLLLLQDATLPSLATLIAGEPIRGSWWGHPKGGEIFAVAGELDHHADVTCAKLVSGKVTFVHRRLWSSLLAMATSGEGWQLDGLSREAKRLLARIRSSGSVKAAGKAGAELERRLLVRAHSVHSPQGKHIRVVESWEHWCEGARFKPRAQSPVSARARFERVAAAWQERSGVRVNLPWT